MNYILRHLAEKPRGRRLCETAQAMTAFEPTSRWWISRSLAVMTKGAAG